jgi:hypothetical protein
MPERDEREEEAPAPDVSTLVAAALNEQLPGTVAAALTAQLPGLAAQLAELLRPPASTPPPAPGARNLREPPPGPDAGAGERAAEPPPGPDAGAAEPVAESAAAVSQRLAQRIASLEGDLTHWRTVAGAAATDRAAAGGTGTAALDAIDAAFGEARAGAGAGADAVTSHLRPGTAAETPAEEYRADRELPHTGRFPWPARLLLGCKYEADFWPPQYLAEVVPGYKSLTKAEQHELLYEFPCVSRIADIVRWHELGAYDLPAPVLVALSRVFDILESRVSYLEQQALVAGGLRTGTTRQYWQDLQASQLEEARATPARGQLGVLHDQVLQSLREQRAREVARAELRRRATREAKNDEKPG